MWGRPPQESGKRVGKPAVQTKRTATAGAQHAPPLIPLTQGRGEEVWPCRGVYGGWGGASQAAGVHGGGTGVRALCPTHSSSEEYQVAQAALARTFPGKFNKFVVPCVIASGDIQDRKGAEPLSFRCGALPRVGHGQPESHCPSPATNPPGAQGQGRSGWVGGDQA